MAVVVDASAVAAIAFGEPEGHALVAHLMDETLLAPTLLDYEVASIAWKKTRAHPDTAPLIQAALDAASRLIIARVPVPAVDMLRVARETGLTAYDAAYLWLARAHDAELVTLDRTLAAAATDRHAEPPVRHGRARRVPSRG
jgi:predicted nucleic acid-binding protein